LHGGEPRGHRELKAGHLNPGRYVGAAEATDDGVEFETRIAELAEELRDLQMQANMLFNRIEKAYEKQLS
jgi:hypothetical protein